jgi:hypothetical protein
MQATAYEGQTGRIAFVGTTPPPAHVADVPVYVAPAARVFEVAPAGHVPVAGTGTVQVAPSGRAQANETSSGKGIAVDSNN